MKNLINIAADIKAKISDYKFDLCHMTIGELKARFNGKNIHQRSNEGPATHEAQEDIENGSKAVRIIFAGEVKGGDDVIIDGNHFKDNLADDELFLVCIYYINTKEVRELMGIHNNFVNPTPSWKLYTNSRFSEALDTLKETLKFKLAEKSNKHGCVIDYRDAVRIMVNAQTNEDGGKKEFLADKPSSTKIKATAAFVNKLHTILQKGIAPDLHRLFARGSCLAAWASYFNYSNYRIALPFLSRNQLVIKSYLKGKRLPGSLNYSFWKFIFANCFDNTKDIGEFGKVLTKKGIFVADEVK